MIDDDLTNKFFLDSDSEQLRKIHQWARARYAAPWAVFGAVLLRVAASTGPEVQLPGLIGGRASLNLMAAFVAPSGGGKGTSDKVSRLAWPTVIHEEGMGSGEGIADLFKQSKKEGEEQVSRAIISVPEIDTLTGLTQRQGNTVLATLKAAAMGERLGSKGASAATSRMVAPHTYRMCLSVGGQPGHTGVIFGDTTGGTPQRFLWFPTVDPTMPEVAAVDPEPLDTALPAWTRVSTDVVEIQYGTDEIARTVIAAHIARQRGDAEALDGHALLTRCKVAAVLAIMHHQSVVSEREWQLSETVMAVSDSTRAWILEQAKRTEREKKRDKAIARAVDEEIVSDHKLRRAKQAVIRWLGKSVELSSRDLRQKLKADIRADFDAAIAELADDGLLHVIDVPNGRRYRIAAEGTRVPEVHPQKAQFIDGVPQVHGVPQATVTDLDSPSSGTSRRQDDDVQQPTTMSCYDTVKPPRPTTCQRCYVTLPAAATEPLCDECDGAPERAPASNETRAPAVVVHNEALAKREHQANIDRFNKTPDPYRPRSAS